MGEPRRPSGEEMLERVQISERLQNRASLRIYLGYAPGVGKTFAMLNEGRRRKSRGADVVIGLVETYNRPLTVDAMAGLEVVPRQKVNYRGVVVEEMDLDAIIARRPQVALVDELAHSNVPGLRHEKRYQDVLELLANDINVISTLNIQHIESLKDTVERVTGVVVRETIPDWVVDGADEIELIDQSPEALQKRMSHGNIYPRDRAEEALRHFFRKGNLTALRELALRRLAENTDDRLEEYRRSQGIEEPWPCAEKVLVCVPPTPQASQIVRRGVHMAQRLQAKLIVLYVAQPRTGLNPKHTRGHQDAQKALQLARDLGATVVTLESSKVADALVDFASEQNITQIVMGETTRSRLREMLQGSVTREVLRRTNNLDVHIVQSSGPE